MNHLLPNLKEDALANLFSNNARKIFNLPAQSIQEGVSVELTLFNRQDQISYTKTGSKSKSANSPFWDKSLKGKVIGTFCKGQLHLNK